MHPFLQNKFVRYALFAVGALAVIFIALVFLAMMNHARYDGTGLGDSMQYSLGTPTVSTNSVARDYDMMDGADDMGMMAKEMESSYFIPSPTPVPDGYTSGLESYETTQYSVSGRLNEFDVFCDTLTELKRGNNIHFKYLNESTNNCNATFYVAEGESAAVLNTLTNFKNVEYVRNTESVTRHKERLESQTTIVEQQLASVSRSLTVAETQFDELATYARAANDAAALSEAIRYKLQNVDTLTQRKINLTAQLNNLYQQAADLAERIDVVQFDVNVTRANPIYVGKYERQWERAWQELRDTFTDSLIGVTAFFGIFLLRAVQFLLYALVVIFLIRGLWKFARLVWRKW